MPKTPSEANKPINIALLIPAYNPGMELIDYVRILSQKMFCSIIIVNDGSSSECNEIFAQLQDLPNITLLRHGVNLGKGMALKTGLNYAYVTYPDLIGVVTADADGQHHVSDVLKVAQSLIGYPQSLTIGVRGFGIDTPLRSRIGNGITKILYRLLVGGKLTDTQSGLRGIPRDLIPKLLRIQSNGYEFELDMLLLCQHTDRSVEEQPIKTIYIEGNKSSHFNPFFDSMKIYFVLFRSMIVSLITVTIDTLIFIPLYNSTHQLLMSQFTGRFIGMTFQYSAAKKLVFYSDKKHSQTLPLFVLVVVILGFVSYGLIELLTLKFSISVAQAKILSEALIYLAGFAIQRDFIFTSRRNNS